jgi:RND family efflux transporter MFP subunit
MIANLSNIWVIADIYEYEIPWVKLGQEAEMSLSYFPGKKFKGKVTFIDPILDSKSRTLKVRMEFPNPDSELKPEMFANIILKSEVARKELTIPEEAVIYSGDKTTVMVLSSSGTFDSRELNLGVKSQGYVQVLQGLKEGEKVVTSSVFLIDSESRLSEALNKMEDKRMKMPDQKMRNKKLILMEKPKN